MKSAPLVVLRVGYMERYDGPDTILGGGAYVEEHGVGGEVFNFKPSRGKCYGYAMSRHFSGVNLSYVDSSRTWREGDELAGVDVVFIARKPGVGQVVVGWYRNATVFHQQYRARRGAIPGMKEDVRYFLCVASADSVRLIPEAERIFEVPYAPNGHRGFPGQSNVWYPTAHQDVSKVSAFTKSLNKYINKKSGVVLANDESAVTHKVRGGKRRVSKPDHAHNALVETAAVDAVWKYYETAGFKVRSVEDENVGWDLVATKGSQIFHLEVKGTSGAVIYFELTPNEYDKMKLNASSYRVCVVCDALTAPRIFDLRPESTSAGWRLVSKSERVKVRLMERVAAVGTEALDKGAES